MILIFQFFNKIFPFFQVIFILFVYAVFGYTPSERELPSDETEAPVLLENGELDSVLWARLLPFYQKPLIVPSGELSILEELFPELSDRLPVEQSDLDRYIPWGAKEINRFFEDYPELIAFRPFLQFNYPQYRSTGAFSMYMNRSGFDSSATHAGKLIYNPAEVIKFNCTFDLTSYYARWERRYLEYRPFRRISLRMGNTVPFPDRGLIYGHFPAYDSSKTDALADWLYGGAPSWNGCGLTCRGSDKIFGLAPEITLFSHVRPLENIYGCKLSVTSKKKISGAIGVSRLSVSGMEQRTFYLHGSLLLRMSDLKSEISCGVNTLNFTGIPFWSKTVFNRNGGISEVEMVHLPGHFYGPRSLLFQRFKNEMKLNDTLRSAITFIKLSLRRQSFYRMSIKPVTELWFDALNVSRGRFSLQSEGFWKRLKGCFSISHEFGNDEECRFRNIILGKLEYNISSFFSVTTRYRLSFVNERKFVYSGTVAPVLYIFTVVSILPAFTIQRRENGTTGIFASVRQKMTLFDKTFTEFIFEKNISEQTENKGLRIEGKASFFF